MTFLRWRKGDPDLHCALLWIRKISSTYKDGWARGKALDFPLNAHRHSQPLPSSCHPPVPVLKSTIKLKAAFTSYTRRVALGMCRPAAKPLSRKKHSLQLKKTNDMRKALLKVHDVFMKHARSSPRLHMISYGPDDMRVMQFHVYLRGSKSAAVVFQQARTAEAFFLDILTYGWSVEHLAPFHSATWVRSRVCGGKKSASPAARATLRLVHAATDWRMHFKHALVASQFSDNSDISQVLEPAVQARSPSSDMVTKLERLITSGPTPQTRCIAGFFVLLAFSAARSADAQGSRNLRITRDAISGESIMKTSKTWRKWFCNRFGLECDWASDWIVELKSQGLPGDDFIL